MPLLNYTTSVASARSMAEVQSLLVAGGARQIMTEYGPGGAVVGLSFSIETPVGKQGFTLPVHADRVQAVLERERINSRFQTAAHAERVAWRILKDWIEAQLAIVRTEMVTFDQVMLPYMRSVDGRTVYELYLDSSLALPAPAEAV